MEYQAHEEIASVTLFDLRLSEGELQVYESCIDYVLSTCSKEKIYELTGCEVEELRDYKDELVSVIKAYVLKEFLPDKYKE